MANIGGSGAGITRFDDELGVLTAAEEGTLHGAVDGSIERPARKCFREGCVGCNGSSPGQELQKRLLAQKHYAERNDDSSFTRSHSTKKYYGPR